MPDLVASATPGQVDRQRLIRWGLAVSAAVPLALFVVLMATAMALYPGGTWEDPLERGHSFWRNYFCDLLRPTSLNDESNALGARLAEAALFAFAVGLVPFFLAAPLCFPERARLGAIVRGAGILCGIGGVGVVLVPSWRFGALAHGAMLLLAAVPGLIAAGAAALGAWHVRRRAPAIAASAVATVAVTALIAVIFARQLAIGAETTFGLAALQKLAVVLALAWIALTFAHVMKGAHPHGTAPSSDKAPQR